jgi:lysophospholipase L1-like esterase
VKPSIKSLVRLSPNRFWNIPGPAKLHRNKLGASRLTVLGATLFAFFFSFLLAETAVRIRQYVKYGSAKKELYETTMDSRTGLPVLVPNQVTGTIRINSLGFRGPEILQPRPPNGLRFAFLGASTNFCAENSSNAATWPDLVWTYFQQAEPDLKWDYINAGVPGYSVEDSLKDFNVRVAPLYPDVVVIYHATNDLSVDTRELARQKSLFSGKAETDNWLVKYSVLVRLIELNLQIRQRQRRAQAGAAHLEYNPVELSQGFHRRLRELVQAAQRVSPVVAVATFSIKMRRDQSPQQQLRNANSSLYYMPYMSLQGLLDGFAQYNQVIRDVARETGAILIEGENDIPGDDAYFNDSVHFTDAGSAAMARRIEAALKAAPPFQQLCLQRRLKVVNP